MKEKLLSRKDTKRRLKALIGQKIIEIQITGNKVWITTGTKYSHMVYRIK